MTPSDKIEFESLYPVAKCAAWLLARKDTATASLDIGDELSLVWRVSYAGLLLPQKFIGTREEALRDAELWLKNKAGP